ncbi:MAG: hypothetical protein ACREE4_19970 [Stellaceae bacterium]
MGQFATPSLLATDVLAYARALLLETAPVRFLDPAIGTGSFYLALARALAGNPALARHIREFLDAISPEILLGEGRVYGGGLHKLEPNEPANVPADALGAMLSDRPASQVEMFKKDTALFE